MNLSEFRKLHADLKAVEADLSDIAEELRTHPDKPEHGTRPTPAWFRVTKPLFEERKELRAERNRLITAIEAAKAGMLQRPVSMQSLSDIIDGLVEVEACFEERTPVDARAKLEAFIDYLEGEEQRIRGLEGSKAS